MRLDKILTLFYRKYSVFFFWLVAIEASSRFDPPGQINSFLSTM